MYDGGVLEVHDNVTFEANTAEVNGGAVSLHFEIGSHLPGVVFCDRVCQGRLVSLRQLTKHLPVGRVDGLAPITWVSRMLDSIWCLR